MTNLKTHKPVRTTRTHSARAKAPKTRKPQAKDWHDLFIKKLSESGNVRLACVASRVSRSAAYQAKWAAEAARLQDDALHENADGAPKQYDDFAGKWDQAIDEACDRLEQEAWHRAVHGVSKPVFYKGDVCGAIQEYSDALMGLLLKAHRPDKYRERFEHTGANGTPLTSTQTVIYLPENGRQNRDTPAEGTPGEVSL